MMEIKQCRVAIVGATGAVGQEMLKDLEKRDFPLTELRLLASKRSAGKKILFRGAEIEVEEATPDAFSNVDIALFSAGGETSKRLAPEAVKRGAVVIDNSSAYRMDPDVPLVVPEVNPEAVKQHKGIIANPNCSTIQMTVALKPLVDRYGVERVIVSTYQAVSGSGWKAVEELRSQSQSVLQGEEPTLEVMPVGKLDQHYQIAFNVIPQCDVLAEDEYTFEEIKMVRETKKIFADDSIGVTATCVRVPVERGHSESIYVELKDDYELDEVRRLLKDGAGVILDDELGAQRYPMPLATTGRPEVFVGRLRKDLHHPRALNMWVVSDNLLKGAATNTVQIAELLLR
ncbi:aspartate-semialdehyde dehydrogenase [Mechercharimyces sp. CAU 1602]|uniref:aspartate-semialdehyde dehydrogenase n=1 Tax=Mechercharimyces sp. CAU 1602 TaxID=2973933 RepID=UPI002163F4EE|nr:aspartate-semialdehyde dehydrogenase [Mechercharimyces sp. CAU 1602]MCS1351258.1 aspartate-semialdehyde dehydrogenase [Mechercharimyces sp. CAU 1602]